MDQLTSTIDIEKVLDVTQIEPRLKHPTIFKYFDNLQPGDYFIIHNDHDPKPVYYQLLGERGNIFSFEYLSKGPEDWFIQIQKNSVATTDYESKKESLVQAATQNTPQSASNLLSDGIILQYDRWPLGFLTDFIEQTDHIFFREKTGELDQLGALIEAKHKQSHPALASLKMYQDQLFATLLFHLTQEQAALFEGIKNIEAIHKAPSSTAEASSEELLALHQLSTSALLKKQANQTLATLLAHIRKQTNNYQAPSDACDSYIYYFKRLEQFDLRLSRYLHLENTILLPKVQQWL